MERLRELMPGLGITLSIVLISFLASSLHEGFDPLVVSLIFGILAVNILGDSGPLAAGVDVSLKFLLPMGILLYGAQVELRTANTALLGWTVVIALVSFGVAYLISRGFGLGRTNAVLLATGLSVCGVSGVALIAPILMVRRDETAISVISVMTVGLTGMLVYKFAPYLFGMEGAEFAFLTGTTLPMLGQVRVVAITGPAGAAALKFMYFRMGLLAVVAGAVVIHARRAGRPVGIPWFMAGFLVLAVLVNLFNGGEWGASIRGWAELPARAALSGGLAAVGLSLEFDAITSRGALPLFAAYLSWGIMVMAVYLLLSVAG